MNKNVLIYILLLLLGKGLFGQESKVLTDAIKTFAESKKVHCKMKIETYKYNEAKAFIVQEAEINKSDSNYLYKYEYLDFFSDSKIMLKIDHESKSIKLMGLNNAEIQAGMPLNDSLMNEYKDAKLLSKNKNLYMFEITSGIITTRIEVDAQSGKFTKMIYFYPESMHASQSKTIIYFTELLYSLKVPSEQLSIYEYITLTKDSSVVPAKKYMNYIIK